MTRYRRLLPFAGFALVLAVWAFLTSSWLNSREIVTSFSPWNTAPALLDLLQNPRTWDHTVATLRRVLGGLSIAFVIGVPFGVMMGSSPTFNRMMSASTQFLRMISPLAWMPVAVMILGIGDKPIFFLIAVSAVWSIALNTAAGVGARDQRWVEMSNSLGASSFETLWHVTIPAIRGQVLTGLRVALGVAWIVLVPAEMLGVRAGLGYAILDARDRLAYPEIMGIILLIGALGWALDTTLRLAERRWSGGEESEQTMRKSKKQRSQKIRTGGEEPQQSSVAAP